MEGNSESLEERLERIRLRNEEIERKHREAEEDRIRALKDNAMVEVKSPRHEDWPKAHKYDTLDFTYDVDPAQLQDTQTAIAASSESSATADPPGRKKKTFAEGNGPPPDPLYNFLADSERDGSEPTAAGAAGANPRRIPQDQPSSGFRRQNSQTNSFSSVEKGKANQPKKNLQTNWRERDTVKTPEATSSTSFSSSTEASPPIIDDSAIAATYHQTTKKPLPLTAPKQSQPSMQNDKRPPALRAVNAQSAQSAAVQPQPPLPEQLLVEQRGNLQFRSKNGEIQSVKLTSTRATPGTGRVGLPRAITKQSQPPPSPAQLGTSTAASDYPPSPSSPIVLPAEAKNPPAFRIPNMAYPPPVATSVAAAATVAATTAVVANKAPTKKFSVQDRLTKLQVPT